VKGAAQPEPNVRKTLDTTAILNHTYDLSDEMLCEAWLENPYYQYFCGPAL
jgi:Transposase domain (DUF772)